MQLSINTHNQLLDLSLPRVMAIVNVTPDSFYTSWNKIDDDTLLGKVQTLLDQGADIIDIGACSTRPHSTPASASQEWDRLCSALLSIRSHFPNAIISVDTFRAEIAEKAIQHGADIINDVYGGRADERMWDVVDKHHVPYILTHAEESVQDGPFENDHIMKRMMHFFESRLDQLHRMGIADVLIDPGFGFGKTEEENYTILQEMKVFTALRAPILAGISRKSMLYKPLGLTPLDVLPATIAANTIALEHGANILRVHDVAAAKQAITVFSLTNKNKNE